MLDPHVANLTDIRLDTPRNHQRPSNSRPLFIITKTLETAETEGYRLEPPKWSSLRVPGVRRPQWSRRKRRLLEDQRLSLPARGQSFSQSLRRVR